MKKNFVLLALYFLTVFCEVALATPSLNFETKAGSTSWTVYGYGNGYEISFDNIIVNNSNPVSSNLVGDELILPTMALSDISLGSKIIGGMLYKVVDATLVPVVDLSRGLEGKLYIYDDLSPSLAVMEADFLDGTGNMLSVGASYMAYTNSMDDLYNLTSIADYSVVIDGLIAAEADGMSIDLSFSGESACELYDLLKYQGDYFVTGTLSGQINAQGTQQGIVSVPVPSAVLLGSFGLACVAYIRGRKLFQ